MIPPDVKEKADKEVELFQKHLESRMPVSVTVNTHDEVRQVFTAILHNIVPSEIPIPLVLLTFNALPNRAKRQEMLDQVKAPKAFSEFMVSLTPDRSAIDDPDGLEQHILRSLPITMVLKDEKDFRRLLDGACRMQGAKNDAPAGFLLDCTIARVRGDEARYRDMKSQAFPEIPLIQHLFDHITEPTEYIDFMKGIK